MPEEVEDKYNKASRLFSIFVLAVFGIAILVNIYNLYIRKNFDFTVETSCEPLLEECFERDCTNPDDCPPNELSNFKRWTIKARDFKMCENEDCTKACETGLIKCEKIACTPNEEAGETCVDPTQTEDLYKEDLD